MEVNKMQKYKVWIMNGKRVIVEASNPSVAKQLAWDKVAEKKSTYMGLTKQEFISFANYEEMP